jgi:hypothetical protein
MLIGALAGSVKHALNHKAAGLDFVICQGSEGGGHTGDVGSHRAVARGHRRGRPHPGAGRRRRRQRAPDGRRSSRHRGPGVWTGTLWLTVEEADVPPKQMESYLRRDLAGHGPVPFVHRQAVPDAEERLDRRVGGEDTPDPLGMPLQMMVAIEAVSRGHAYPEAGARRELQPGRPGHRKGDDSAPDQGRGLLGMVEEYIEAIERLEAGVAV